MESNLERFKGQYIKDTAKKKPKIKPKGVELKGSGGVGNIGPGSRTLLKKGGCL